MRPVTDAVDRLRRFLRIDRAWKIKSATTMRYATVAPVEGHRCSTRSLTNNTTKMATLTTQGTYVRIRPSPCQYTFRTVFLARTFGIIGAKDEVLVRPGLTDRLTRLAPPTDVR